MIDNIMSLIDEHSKNSNESTDKDSYNNLQNEIATQFNNSTISFPLRIKARIEFLAERIKKAIEEIKYLINLIKEKIPGESKLSSILLQKQSQASRHIQDISLSKNTRNDDSFNSSSSDSNNEFISDEYFESIFKNNDLNQLEDVIQNMSNIEQYLSKNPADYDEIANMALHNDFSSSRCKNYSMHTPSFKKKLCELTQSHGLKSVSNHYKVPVKSLKRWLTVGYERKKGGGRKSKDPVMENKLYKWYEEYHITNNQPVTSSIIKKKALEFRTNNDFYASKGWLEKFKKKYNLEIVRDSKRKEITKQIPSKKIPKKQNKKQK